MFSTLFARCAHSLPSGSGLDLKQQHLQTPTQYHTCDIETLICGTSLVEYLVPGNTGRFLGFLARMIQLYSREPSYLVLKLKSKLYDDNH
jgi:hypothetical protein